MKFWSYKEESKKNWGANAPTDPGISDEHLMLGAVLRIADALDRIAACRDRDIDEVTKKVKSVMAAIYKVRKEVRSSQ